MPVLWITVILSLLLALVFLALFVKEHGRSRFGGSERSALLPLEEEAFRSVPPPTAQTASSARPPKPPLPPPSP